MSQEETRWGKIGLRLENSETMEMKPENMLLGTGVERNILPDYLIWCHIIWVCR